MATGSDLLPLAELAPVMLEEGRKRLPWLTLLFAGIALLALGIGLVWPKRYVASTTILVQENDIIKPLLEGRAVPTGVADRASIAREVIFSRKIMQGILEAGGWMASHPTAVQQDKLIDEIRSDTSVRAPRPNLIEISYGDFDPERAYQVTKKFAEMFMQESLAAKERESRDAFQFISDQVEEYKKKLSQSEDALKAYRTTHPDAQPGADAAVSSSISGLGTQIEQARLSLAEQRSKAASLKAQLAGESEITAVQTRQGMIRAQLADLQAQLDKLLLTYTDQYPDVIRTRHQIQDLRNELTSIDTKAAAAKTAGTALPVDGSVEINPMYQQLRTQLSATEGDIAATESRLGTSQAMLKDAQARGQRVSASDSEVAELTRDYEVNRDIYQDMLKRRENARVSMNLDQEKRGLTFRIQNPAALPLVPSGLRLLHFAFGGFLLALAIPIGLLFSIGRFDPRIRSVPQLERLAGLPVLAVVPAYHGKAEQKRGRRRIVTAIAVFVAVVAIYLIVWFVRR